MRRVRQLMVAALVVTLAACSSDAGVSTVAIDPIGDVTGPATTDPGGTPPGQTPPGQTAPEQTAPEQTGPSVDDGSLDWEPCEGLAATGLDLECATLVVPVDYAVPDGPTLDIAVARLASADDDERIGSLVFNPGGPGGSGIDFLQNAALIMPAELASRFDLVSFDPRGVGASTAVTCDVDFDDDITLLAEGDDAGWNDLVSEAQANEATCSNETVGVWSYLGTNNAARDLDQLREALGDDLLSYVGFSYGTRLGATYAELFPDNVRALVLDGAVKPTTDFTELNSEQGVSLDRSFERFAAECDSDTDCVLQELGPAIEVYTALVSELAATGSLPTSEPDRVLTPGELELAAIASLYNTQLWPLFAQGLYDATTVQDATLLQALVDTYVGRQPDGSYDNSQSAGFAINCADDPSRPTEAVVRQNSVDAASLSSWFGDFLRASTGCIGGPLPVDTLLIGPAVGAPPILVIGNTGDPATPYEWSVAMADLLASAELYTVESNGHTAFLSVPCVEPVVVDYLVDLIMPPAGSSCVNTADDDVFPPAGDGEFDQLIALFDCLRENGADIPEVTVGDLLADPSGEILLDAIDPTDPAFGQAVLACQDLIPDL